MIYRLIVLIILIVSCTDSSDSGVINVAVASSMHPVLRQIASEFEKESKIKVNLISASSGKLASQINSGAPYDLFFAADVFYTNYLYKQLQLKTPPKNFATSNLYLVSNLPILFSGTDSLSSVKKWLVTDVLKKIAIPNPSLAPYGKAAYSMLEKLQLSKVLQPKLVYTESVSQSNQFIYSKSVEVGFTSQSSGVFFLNKKGFYSYEVPNHLYQPIQNSYLITSKTNLELTNQFIRFFQTGKAKQILEAYAYTTI